MYLLTLTECQVETTYRWKKITYLLKGLYVEYKMNFKAEENKGIPWGSCGQDPVLSLPNSAGSIPGQGTKTPQAVWHGQKKKKTQTKNKTETPPNKQKTPN